jgi:hypothetical protein
MAAVLSFLHHRFLAFLVLPDGQTVTADAAAKVSAGQFGRTGFLAFGVRLCRSAVMAFPSASMTAWQADPARLHASRTCGRAAWNRERVLAVATRFNH